MATVEWSNAALNDLEAIRAYVAEDNPEAANRLAGRLVDAGDGLAIFPDRGRSTQSGARELTTVRPYVILYDHANDVVSILRVRHGARGPT